MLFINCEINVDLNWSKSCVIVTNAVADHGRTFSITDAKLYDPVVALSTQDNTKVLEQLKSGFTKNN